RVGVGLFDALEKLPRVSRERLHITPLAFRINRVEGKGRLARPRDTRHHGQLIVRNLKINVFEIVHTRAANRNAFRGCESRHRASNGSPFSSAGRSPSGFSDRCRILYYKTGWSAGDLAAEHDREGSMIGSGA